MIWSRMIFDRNNIKPNEMTHLQQSKCNELYDKVDVQYKLLKLKNYVLKEKGSSKRNSGSLKSIDFISLIYYYDLYYKNGVWKKNDILRYNRPNNMPVLTKNKRVYCKKKIEEYLEEYKSTKSQSINDDDFIIYLISHMPNSVFTGDEIDLWRKIYDFATTQKIEFRIIDRKSKCEKEIREQTYIEFANTFDISQESCKGRFFVRLFCQQTAKCYTRVDDLLRYKAKAEFFSKQDFTSIGIDEQDFFDVIETIKRISKKEAD